MSSLLFGMVHSEGVPSDENAVRRNTPPVDSDDAPSVADNAPEFNSLDTDTDPELGLVGRQVASKWNQSQKYAPFWGPAVDVADEHNRIVDRQVSSSGTAAQRESAGQFGHGTMPYAEGIEPVLRDGSRYGNDYMAVGKPPAQQTMDAERGVQPVTSVGSARDAIGALGQYGKFAAREASDNAFYAGFYASMVEAR